MTAENTYQAPNSNLEQNVNHEYGNVKLLAVAGRIGRIRYIAYSFGISFAAMFVIMGGAALIGAQAGNDNMGVIGMIGIIIIIAGYAALFVISIMLTIQRAHDFNTSGWLCLIIFVPLASLIFFFIPGTKGENDYGLQTPPNGGATIVVILLVLCIPVLGILAAIAVPAYQGYLEQSKQASSQQQ